MTVTKKSWLNSLDAARVSVATPARIVARATAAMKARRNSPPVVPKYWVPRNSARRGAARLLFVLQFAVTVAQIFALPTNVAAPKPRNVVIMKNDPIRPIAQTTDWRAALALG